MAHGALAKAFFTMKSRFIICAVWLLLASLPMKAQWSGSLDLSGGLGGMHGNIVTDDEPIFHGLAQGVFLLNYRSDKFIWSTRLDAKWEPTTTDNVTVSYKNEKLAITYKAANTEPITTGIRSDFTWILSPEKKYSTWILYKYKNDNARNTSMIMDGGLDEVDNFMLSVEYPHLNEHTVGAGFKTFHSFDSGRHILHSSFSVQTASSRRLNTWMVAKNNESDGSVGVIEVGDDFSAYAWKYRITPSSTDIDLAGDIHLENTPLDGDTKLKFTPGVRFASKHSLDQNSGATLVSRLNFTDDAPSEESVWKDSLRLRESFNYLCVNLDHYLKADLNWRDFEGHFDYAFQVYARRLNDDSHKQSLAIKGMYPVGSSTIKWNINPHHALSFNHLMSVKHPDYLMICWYDRTAGYLDQLYRGNELLISPQTLKYALEYDFNWNRFLLKSSISYKEVINEIDQTWTNEEIEGRLYKVFQWLNSADSRSVGLSQSFGWRGKIIKANAGISYNQSRRTAKSNGAIKNSFDWKLNADITATLGKGWTLGADAKYQSKQATFFTIFKEYCELNLRVQKEFKHITIFLEGHDLLDQMRETSFLSEELEEYWIEQIRGNRRLVVLGAKWKF